MAIKSAVIEPTIIEAAVNVVDDTVQLAEQVGYAVENEAREIIKVSKNNPFILAGVAIIAATVSGALVYKFSEKRLRLKYDVILSKEIEAAKNFYKMSNKTDEYQTPEDAVKALIPEEVSQVISSYQGREKKPYNRPESLVDEDLAEDAYEERAAETRPPSPVPPKNRNVFERQKELVDKFDWDPIREERTRLENPNTPFVISLGEFEEPPAGYDQSTMTYYVDDDTLCDEREQPVDNVEYVVGDDNLTRFGHGSGDKNVVYIRNENISMDFEVLRSETSYTVDVLGLDPPETLQHSHRRAAGRRFRGTDE